MSKRTLLLIISALAALVLTTTGTLAYLSDSDADVNVMTLGNVDIVQNEQERTTDGTLDEFTQNKPAYPAGGPIDWADETIIFGDSEFRVFTDDLKNVVDKFVTVTNTGRSDAYVRTIIALEAPEYDPNDLIHVNVNGSNGVTQTDWAPVDIDGVQYVYSVFTYTEALAAGETSLPSLMQLFLDQEATNDDVATFGDTWEVLVLSQASQVQGFSDATTALDTAFGDVTGDKVIEWFGNATIGSLSAPFEGDFNGQGNTISNLSMKDDDGIEKALFGCAQFRDHRRHCQERDHRRLQRVCGHRGLCPGHHHFRLPPLRHDQHRDRMGLRGRHRCAWLHEH